MGTFRHIDEVIHDIAGSLSKNGIETSIDRKGCNAKILEVLNYNFTISNSVNVFSGLKWFKQDPIWMLDEIISELLALNPPLMHRHFPGVLSNFTNYSGRHNYTYGERWIEFTQIKGILDKLSNDRNSRQAVMVIYRGIDTHSDNWDVPCTLTHQFLIRNGECHIIVNMRSSDLFRGFKYDVVLASFLNLIISAFLGVKSGSISFNIGSMHVYQKAQFGEKNDDMKLFEEYMKSREYKEWLNIHYISNVNPFSFMSFKRFFNDLRGIHNNIIGKTLEHPRGMALTGPLFDIYTIYAMSLVDNNWNEARVNSDYFKKMIQWKVKQ